MDDASLQPQPPIQQPRTGGIIAFLNHYKLLLAALALVLFFFYILFLSATSTQQTINQTFPTTIPLVSTITPVENPTATPVIKTPLSVIQSEITWEPHRFSDIETNGIQLTQTPLSDGSTRYTYNSSNPNRPNEIIVKDNTVIFRREVISQKYIYHYTGSLDAPDYSFQGSRFYGNNSMTYLYLQKGTAFVADSSTTLVQEQLIFKPMTLDEFKRTYGNDITDYTVIPTLPEE